VPYTSFFHQGIFDQKQRDCWPHPLYFSLFAWLKIKFKGCRYNKSAVIEVESQVVPNTTSRMHFKLAEALGMVYYRGVRYKDVVEALLPYRNATKIFLPIFNFELHI
jgi:hypothetical protein